MIELDRIWLDWIDFTEDCSSAITSGKKAFVTSASLPYYPVPKPKSGVSTLTTASCACKGYCSVLCTSGSVSDVNVVVT